MPGAFRRSQALPEAPRSSQEHPGAKQIDFQLVLEALGGEGPRTGLGAAAGQGPPKTSF